MEAPKEKFLPIIGATVAGILFVPTEPILGGLLLLVVGAWGINFYRRHSKLAVVFRNCGLVNRDGQALRLRETKQIEGGIMYRYSLPPGLCTSDVKKHQEAIEQFLGAKEIVISRQLKDVIIEVYYDEN